MPMLLRKLKISALYGLWNWKLYFIEPSFNRSVWRMLGMPFKFQTVLYSVFFWGWGVGDLGRRKEEIIYY